MEKKIENSQPQDINRSDLIDLNEIVSILWASKRFITIVTFLFSLFGVFYSLSLTDIYKSEAIVASTSGSNEMSQISGLASLAGISLSQNTGPNKVNMGIEIIQSLNFFENFSSKYDLLPSLLAAKKWNRNENVLEYDESLFDSNKFEWVNEKILSRDNKFSIQKAHKKFLGSLNIEDDLGAGLYRISYEHISPFIAEKCLKNLIIEINEISRMEDIKVAEKSISFLENEINQTSLLEIKSSLNTLIEKQLEKITIAKATPEYLFKILSPPFSPEKKVRPARTIICLIFAIFGFILSLLYVISRKYFFLNKYSL